MKQRSASRDQRLRETVPIHRSPLASIAASLLRLHEENSRRAELGLTGPAPGTTQLDSGAAGEGYLPRDVALIGVQEAGLLSTNLTATLGGTGAGGAVGPATMGPGQTRNTLGSPTRGPGGIGSSHETTKRIAAAEMTAAEKVLSYALQIAADGTPGVVPGLTDAGAGGGGRGAKKQRRPRSASAAQQIAEAVASGLVPPSIISVKSQFNLPSRLLYSDEACTTPREGETVQLPVP
jgi:hypothetical protein